MLQAKCTLCTDPLPLSWLSGNLLAEDQLSVVSVTDALSMQLVLIQGRGPNVKFLLKTMVCNSSARELNPVFLQGISTGIRSALVTFLKDESSELLLAVLSQDGLRYFDTVTSLEDQEGGSIAISARRHHALHRVGETEYLVVGGLLEEDYLAGRATALSDCYIVNLGDPSTESLAVSGPFLLPYPIAGCTISTIGQLDRFPWSQKKHILIGGYIDSTECNSRVMEYNSDEKVWTALDIELLEMTPRHSHTAITISDRYIVIYGGFTATRSPLYDMWVIDLETMSTRQIALAPEGPALSGCTLYYNVVSDDLFFLSGRGMDEDRLSSDAYVIQGFGTMIFQCFDSLASTMLYSLSTSSMQTTEIDSSNQTIEFLKYRLNTIEIGYLKQIISMRQALEAERRDKQRLLAILEKQILLSTRERRSTLVASLSKTSSMQISLSHVGLSNEKQENSLVVAPNALGDTDSFQHLIFALVEKMNGMEKELATINMRLRN